MKRKRESTPDGPAMSKRTRSQFSLCRQTPDCYSSSTASTPSSPQTPLGSPLIEDADKTGAPLRTPSTIFHDENSPPTTPINIHPGQGLSEFPPLPPGSYTLPSGLLRVGEDTFQFQCYGGVMLRVGPVNDVNVVLTEYARKGVDGSTVTDSSQIVVSGDTSQVSVRDDSVGPQTPLRQASCPPRL